MSFLDSDIFVRNYLSLKNYITSEGIVSLSPKVFLRFRNFSEKIPLSQKLPYFSERLVSHNVLHVHYRFLMLVTKLFFCAKIYFDKITKRVQCLQMEEGKEKKREIPQTAAYASMALKLPRQVWRILTCTCSSCCWSKHN